MSFDAVLVVDPDPLFVQIAQRSLNAAGFDVRGACCLTEACGVLAGGDYGVVVAATDLPFFGETDFIGLLAAHYPHTECVLLTAHTPAWDPDEIYSHGNVFEHMWKPLSDLGDMARTVARALERRSLRRQNAYLLTELRDARDELREHAEFLVQVERLATVGGLLVDYTAAMEAALSAATDSLTRGSDEAERDLSRRGLGDALAEAQRAVGECTALLRQLGDYLAEPDEEAVAAVQIDRVVEEAVDLMRPAIVGRGIALSLEVSDDAVLLDASPARLRQALAQIIMNAVQAMPSGGTLGVSVAAIEGDAGGGRIRIADTGPGIAPDVLPHVFDPFFTTRPLGAGTGLGLSIARTVVREHDGEIQVESVPGEGAMVTITLPWSAQAVQPVDDTPWLRAA